MPLITDPPASALANRLRELRLAEFGVAITQPVLAKALGVSVPSISAWEKHVPPPKHRLGSYALFFATPRSVENGRPRLPDPGDLTPAESARRRELEAELLALWGAARGQQAELAAAGAGGGQQPGVEEGFWRFTNNRPVTIVCARLPESFLRVRPFQSQQDPDFDETYGYSDLRALIELYGHLRAMNPYSEVNYVAASSALRQNDYCNHLVLLGGVDFNEVTREVMREINIPVRQISRESEGDTGAFEVQEGDAVRPFRPLVETGPDGSTFLADVAHFYRGPNPYNKKRTVTICNGMFGKGTEGAVRASTDPLFRDRNCEYVRQRFGMDAPFSLLFRVTISKDNRSLTPDWTLSETRLHEWTQ